MEPKQPHKLPSILKSIISNVIAILDSYREKQSKTNTMKSVKWLHPHKGFGYFEGDVCTLPDKVANELKDAAYVVIIPETEEVPDKQVKVNTRPVAHKIYKR